MSEHYDAVYNAVRDRIGLFYPDRILEDVLRNCFNDEWSRTFQDTIVNVGHEQMRPSRTMPVKILRDGTKWSCSLHWPKDVNMMEQLVEFGDTPEAACEAFDKYWLEGSA